MSGALNFNHPENKMKKIILWTFLLISITPVTVYADKMVVWNLKPQSGVSEKEAATVSSIITSEIARISKNTVISEADIKSVVDGEQIKMSCGADDSSCIAEIGAAMGAPLSVSGTFSKMGDYWIITLQLIDVRKVEVLSRVSKKFKGGENSLVESITPMICELFNDKECSFVSSAEDTKKKTAGIRQPVPWKRAAGWTFAVTGSLGLGAGFAGHALMNQAKKDYEETGADEQKYKNFRIMAYTGLIAGSVLIAGGISLLIWDGVEYSRNKKSPKEVSFYVLPQPEGFYAGFQGRW